MSLFAKRLLVSGVTFWFLLTLIGLYFLFPIKEKDGKRYLGVNLRFGIDLVGGSFLTLGVQTEKAIESELLSLMQSIPDRLKEGGKEQPISKVADKEKIILKFNDIPSAQAASIYLNDKLQDLVTKVKDMVVELQLAENKKRKIEKEAVETNIQVMHSRLNTFNVEEVSVAAKGDRQIVVELPNVNPQEARAMIGKSAVLEFKLVEMEAAEEKDILYKYDALPEGMEVLPHRTRMDGKSKEYFLVPKYTDITGKLLKNAFAGLGGEYHNQTVVNFEFNVEGGDRFYELTSKNPGRRIAIVLDNEILTAPTIKASIRSRGQIEGNFTSREAKELATLLKSGAFVAPVVIEEDREIGATLGQESIYKGLMSCLVGFLLLFFFGVLYYKWSGVFAFITLLFNLIFLLMGLSYLHATLTLPGIAGIILTAGMAIDASILIYERMKEALLTGVSIKQAVNKGFSDAMAVSLDANITTFITGVVLYKFGTGPVRGFAVTMMLGIITTLISGLFVLRSIFNYMLNNFNIKKLSI